jgi:hypothetical protein
VQPLIAPVGAKLGVDHVLVNGSQLVGEQLVENIDQFLVAFHVDPPEVGWVWASTDSFAGLVREEYGLDGGETL